jgi:hypothetical protein
MVEKGFQLTGHAHAIIRRVNDEYVCLLDCLYDRLRQAPVRAFFLIIQDTGKTTDAIRYIIYIKLIALIALGSKRVQQQPGRVPCAAVVLLSVQNSDFHTFTS